MATEGAKGVRIVTATRNGTRRLTGEEIATACMNYVQKLEDLPDGTLADINIRYEPSLLNGSAFVAIVTWKPAR